MPRDRHVGFGGRAAETHRGQPRQGAAVRPNRRLRTGLEIAAVAGRPRRPMPAGGRQQAGGGPAARRLRRALIL